MTSTVDRFAERRIQQFNPAVIESTDSFDLEQEVGVQSASVAPLFIEIEHCLIRKRSTSWLFNRALSQPVALFRSLSALPFGRGAFKRALVDSVEFEPASLPYNESLLEWLWGERESDREIWLLTSADLHFAKRVANYLGLFDGVIASTPSLSIRGDDKLAQVRQRVPINGVFDYCGNAMADLNIFAAARYAVLVSATAEVQRHTSSQGNVSLVFD